MERAHLEEKDSAAVKAVHEGLEVAASGAGSHLELDSAALKADRLPGELDSRPAGENDGYAELHCHTNFSFKEGASEGSQLLKTAKEMGLYALAITDHDNLCGAMEFSQWANSIGMKAIIGVELTLGERADKVAELAPHSNLGGASSARTTHSAPLAHATHVTLLASDAAGYANISVLTTRAHMDGPERNHPLLAPELLGKHAEGVICLSGCRRSEIAGLLVAGDYQGAKQVGERYLEWFGPDRFFLELQQNLVKGDTGRNRLLARLGRELGIRLVATNNVHYHERDRFHLNDALVAIQHNRSLEEAHRERRPNDQFYMKSPGEMTRLFAEFPDAVSNTIVVADMCTLNLAEDIKSVYKFPAYDVPAGCTQLSWLRQVCDQAAKKKYLNSDPELRARLDERLAEEFRLIEKYDLAGFLLQYHEIIRIAHQIQIDLGIVTPDTTIEDLPPGRGRGSSVALVAGYLIGLSHIDPLSCDLKLERFLPDTGNDDRKIGSLSLDIDLDFPREIREELILAVHERWGYERAVLTGMISTYKVRGAVRDLGKALSLPEDDLERLIKLMDGHAGISDLPDEMAGLEEYRDRLDAPLWRHLLELSQQLNHFPKYLAQHPGGMVLSAAPLSGVVPLQKSAMEGRFICQWDKNSIDDAGFVKIDFLALGALSQMTETVQLIKARHELPVDLSRIDFEDRAVYEDIHMADTIGVFQIESAAQMQTVTRLKPKNLREMAWEVGAVRPGVGVNDGVSMLVRRHLKIEPVTYDHPRERKALERTLGVPLFQDQLVELAMSVAGMSAIDGDQMRRAFTKRDSEERIPKWREAFIAGSLENGVPLEAAEKIFKKFHGLYQFPEAHAFAFGVTAFQMAWLKHYYPLEFFVAIFNNQPMGFYNLETLKEDAGRHGITVLRPDVNLSGELAVIENERLRLGLRHIAHVQEANAKLVLDARSQHGPFKSLADFMSRTGLRKEALDSLADAGALDGFSRPNEEHAVRRDLRWEIGLRYRPVGMQLGFGMPVDQDMVALPEESGWDRMMSEYREMGIHPGGHMMRYLRPSLPASVIRSDHLGACPEGAEVTVAGLVIRRQRPSGKATFITLEDEFGHSPLVVWPQIYKRVRLQTISQLLIASGTVSRRDGTMNIVVRDIRAINVETPALKTRDWG